MKCILKKIKLLIKPIIKRKEYINIIKKNLKEITPYQPTKKQIRWCYYDFIKYSVKYNADIEVDYFKSGIFRKSEFTRQESFANQKRFVWRDKNQNREYWNIYDNKKLFYEKFNEFIGRKYIFVTKATPYKEFEDFIKQCKGDVFAKMPNGCGGKEVFHWKINLNENEINKYYIIAKKDEMIVEEKIFQDTNLAEFAPTSINTMRIVTIIDDEGNPKIANALFRMGNGKSVDNFSAGGIVAKVDIDTGIISYPAINGYGKQFIIHPQTSKQIIGYKIPYWQEYIDFALKLAKKYKEMRYVGWDIVRKKDGSMCCIEGNRSAGFDVQEVLLNYGLVPYYESLLHCNKNFDYKCYGGSEKY